MKVLPLPILLVGLISLSLGQTATAPEGSGTTNSPYQIASLENLYWLSQNQNAWADTFVQTADIDASPTASWDNDSGFMPIVLFTGAYDGQGYSISGLQIHRNSRDCVGLFGTTNDATIQNVVLTDASISGFFSVGSLIGFMKGGTLETSSATGTVSGLSGAAGGLTGYVNGNVRIDNSYAEVSVSTDSGSIGGLVGSAISTDTIENSYATGNVQGCAGNAGGLVGFANSIEIIGCYATGLVSGDSANVGGLVGYAISTTINGAFASGSVTGSTNVGGLVGYLVSDTITESYASGTVTGGSNVGGLVGFLSISGIRSSYAIGDVSGTTANIGGLVGKSNVVSLQNSYAAGLVSGDGTDLSGFVGYTDSVSDFAGATACFWDTTATGQISSKAGNAKSMEEMRTQSTYTDSGWDFTNTWAISSNANQGYPYLQRWDLSRKAYAPSIRTLSTSSVTASSVTLEENLDWLGALPATAYGFCWNTTGSPTLADSVINLGTTTDTGTYSTTLTNLSAAIKYHVRAYAVNDSGTDYGSEITVQTPCDLDTNSSGEFLVADYADLKQVASGLLCSDTAIYRLTADIDASATAIENNGEGFTSIPTFQGKLHGAGHAIQHLTATQGLFVSTDSAWIDSLGLTDVFISGSRPAGGLVGTSTADTIRAVYTTGFVTNSNVSAGGLVGEATESLIQGCYSTCNISAAVNAGGLVGYHAQGTIQSSYATGSVNAGLYYAGGLVGYANNDTVLESYSIGSISGSQFIGGLSGAGTTTMTNASFWDKTNSGVDTSFCGIGKSTLEMQTQSTFADSGWNFTSTWALSSSINGGYPYLKALIPQTTSNEPAIISPTVSGIVRLVDGGLFVQGFRGNVGIYSLSGTRVANVSVARNGFYRIALTPGEYAVKGVKK